MTYWYLVADGSRARLFTSPKLDGELEEIEDFVNEEGRLRDQEINTDKPGRSFKGGGRRTAMEPSESASERTEKIFAKKLAKRLNEAFQKNEFDRLGLVAAPKTLGHLREKLNDRVHEAIVGTSSKNLTRQSADEIREHVSEKIL
ncbi:MAG: host attachment protein [Bradymonadaceae bacterium]